MTADGLPDVDVLDVFEIDERGRLVTLEPGRRPDPPRPAPVSARRTEPTPQPRPDRSSRPPGGPSAPPPRLPSRTMGRREVRCAVFVDPIDAAQRLAGRSMLDGIRELAGAPTAPSVDGPTVTWAVVVRVSRWRRPVPAELCVHPSPSWVMTVIEIRPHGRGGRFRSGFVRAGLRIADELSDRLTAVA